MIRTKWLLSLIPALLAPAAGHAQNQQILEGRDFYTINPMYSFVELGDLDQLCPGVSIGFGPGKNGGPVQVPLRGLPVWPASCDSIPGDTHAAIDRMQSTTQLVQTGFDWSPARMLGFKAETDSFPVNNNGSQEQWILVIEITPASTKPIGGCNYALEFAEGGSWDINFQMAPVFRFRQAGTDPSDSTCVVTPFPSVVGGGGSWAFEYPPALISPNCSSNFFVTTPPDSSPKRKSARSPAGVHRLASAPPHLVLSGPRFHLDLDLRTSSVTVDVGGGSVPTTADVLTLGANRPNPFNPRTAIPYEVRRSSDVRLEVFDARGALVKRIVDASGAAPGRYEAVWFGRDSRGHEVPSGPYFVRLSTGVRGVTRKVMLVR